MPIATNIKPIQGVSLPSLSYSAIILRTKESKKRLTNTSLL